MSANLWHATIEKRQTVYPITTVDANGHTIVSTVTVGLGAGPGTSKGPTPTSTTPSSPSPPQQSTPSSAQRTKSTQSSNATGTVPHQPSSSSSQTLSIGAKAGIGTGVAIVALSVLVILLLSLRRKDQRRRANFQSFVDEKPEMNSRWNSKKGHSLPTWKCELAGESHVVELDAGSETVRPELDATRSPRQLESSNEFAPSELSGVEIPAELGRH